MNNEPAKALTHAWRAFFSCDTRELPAGNLEEASHLAFQQTQVVGVDSAPSHLREFCSKTTNQDLVIEAASLRQESKFPSVFGSRPGLVLASRLVLNWNVLLIKEESQLILVFQGVTSCDAILLPGSEILLLVCHLDPQRVADCVAILSRTPEFFSPTQRSRFGGYLIGHTRPYHCLYDGLLALEYIRQAGELRENDPVISKTDEAFLNLSSCLSLKQAHQQLDREAINHLCNEQNIYLLQLGFWFNTRGEHQQFRQLAEAVDRPIRDAALQQSQINEIGAIEALNEFSPLIWIGITGQKRRWIEQVEGTAELLNTLYRFYPRLGIIFDGWTPPLACTDYHRREIQNDNRVIQKIIRRLNFKTRKNTFIIVGLPMIDKVRIGLEADAFVANYTTGSLVIARICGKPGVGHMGRRMMASKHQHIHHKTQGIPAEYVSDISVASTPTGYVNYSIPWQAIYNELLEVLETLPMRPKRRSRPLAIQVPTGR